MITSVTAKPAVQRGRLLPFIRRCLRKSDCDVYVSAPKPKVEFKALKLKIFEKLYNTDFVFSGQNYGPYSFPTFVYDKFRKKLVEVFMQPDYIECGTEEYNIFLPGKKNKRLGNRIFRYFAKEKTIDSGSMGSFHRIRYSGSGVREHQIAIERMIILGRENVKIYSVPEAYKFHKGCGFVPDAKYNLVPREQFKMLIHEYVKKMSLPSEKIRKMLVYYEDTKGIMIDLNTTYANFLEYAYSHRFRYPKLPNFSVNMKLSDEALEEWKKFIEKYPIMLGKKIPLV